MNYCLPLRTCHERSSALSRKPAWERRGMGQTAAIFPLSHHSIIFSELSSHLSIEQIVKAAKFLWWPIFMAGFNYKNLTHKRFHPQKFLRIWYNVHTCTHTIHVCVHYSQQQAPTVTKHQHRPWQALSSCPWTWLPPRHESPAPATAATPPVTDVLSAERTPSPAINN